MTDSLYEFKNDLGKRGIFFCFSGPVSQDLLVEIGSTLKQKMKLEEASNSTVIRVFSMVVEKAQNIIHYSAEIIPKDSDARLEEELSHKVLGVLAASRRGDLFFPTPHEAQFYGDQVIQARGAILAPHHRSLKLPGHTKP